MGAKSKGKKGKVWKSLLEGKKRFKLRKHRACEARS